MNTWPGGKRHAMCPSKHDEWNANNYPGTRQLCSICDKPTGRCEDDTLDDENGEPLCEECWEKSERIEGMPLIYVKKEVPIENCMQCSVSPVRWEKDGVYCVYFEQKLNRKNSLLTRCNACLKAEVKDAKDEN